MEKRKGILKGLSILLVVLICVSTVGMSVSASEVETAPLGTSEPNAEAVANSAATGMVKVTSKVTINGRPAAGFRILLKERLLWYEYEC